MKDQVPRCFPLSGERGKQGFAFSRRGSSGLVLERVRTSLQEVEREARRVALFLFFGVTERH